MSWNSKPEQLNGTPKEEGKNVDRFDIAIRYVMENETGKKWDKDDGSYTYNPGGHSDPPTKWGVILEEYQSFFGGTWTPDMVKAATREQALQVLKKKFWNQVHGDSYLEESHATAVLDTAVNKGFWGCKQVLQHLFGKTFQGEKWVFGPDLIAAVNSMTGQAFLDAMVASVRWYVVKRIEEFPDDEWARKGWEARAERLGHLLVWSPQ